MEWSKLKNIIILILLLVNLFLLSMVGARQYSSGRHEQQTLADAVEVLARSGIRLEEENMPGSLTAATMSVSRDQQGEARLAAGLLGEWSAADLGSGRYSYQGALGEAEFRSNGNFSFSFHDGAHRTQEGEEEAHALKVLESLSFSGTLLHRQEEGERVALTLQQNWRGLPVLSCQVTMEYASGSLRAIAGQRLMGPPQPEGAQELLSLPTALLRFLGGVTAMGDVCSEITAMAPAYKLAASAEATRLIPVWYVTTDTGAYSLNAVTGELERA